MVAHDQRRISEITEPKRSSAARRSPLMTATVPGSGSHRGARRLLLARRFQGPVNRGCMVEVSTHLVTIPTTFSASRQQAEL